ncbi:hypothetical protein HDU79_007000 [Rhizoclosmatium sp. JEL0117]|nr:hypothetical protein HDU79_007000 [Rhizoclosmatium sp. JEL0117]
MVTEPEDIASVHPVPPMSPPPPSVVEPVSVTDDTSVHLSLFPTTAFWIGNDTLTVPVKGWAHVAKRTSFRRNLILGIGKRLLSPIRSDTSSESDKSFDQRAGAFLDAPLAEQQCLRVVLSAKAVSERDDLELVDLDALAGFDCFPDVNSSGLYDATISIPRDAFENMELAQRNTLFVVAYKQKGPQAGVYSVTTCTVVGDSKGYSIISDLDDTIKNSDVHLGALPALNNAFFVPTAQPIPGMSDLYQLFLNNTNTSFHYVSASPFQLVDPINKFLIDNSFPAGGVILRDVWKQSSRRGYKDQVVKELFDHYPNRSFILIGDAGEKDAEIYASVYHKYTDRVAKILIRDVAEGKNAEQIKFVHNALKDVPAEIWGMFTDPGSLTALTLALGKEM